MTDWAAVGGATWIVTHVDETGSTNSDLVAQAALGAADRTVLVADVQRAGRGRLGRRWVAPPASALLFSVLLRPRGVPPQRLGWIGALLGLAICTAIETATGLKADLKWPNDVLIGGRKVAGILAELGSDALVVGAGINVTLDAADLPRPDATSLRLAGAAANRCDRAVLLGAVLNNLAGLLGRWVAAGGDIDRSGLRAEYLARSATVGRRVTVHLPGGRTVTGIATDVATTGAIVVESDGLPQSFTAGDVHHLRTSS